MGTVERDAAAADKERRALEEDANAALSKRIKEKKKTRGRSKLKAKLKKRMKNVVSKETQLLKEKLAARKKKQAGFCRGAGGGAFDGAGSVVRAE